MPEPRRTFPRCDGHRARGGTVRGIRDTLPPDSVAARTSRPRRSPVLIVDDDARIRRVVERALALDGVGRTCPQMPEPRCSRCAREGYDLVLLDLVMPGRDGFAALNEILARRPAQSVLVLSCRSDAAAKIRSLDLGADDYLSKPFHVAELRARVRATLRGRSATTGTTVTHGRLTLDLVHHRRRTRQSSVQLSEREFELLRELLDDPGPVVTKQHLLTRVWGYAPGDSARTSNVVDVCVRRFRDAARRRRHRDRPGGGIPCGVTGWPGLTAWSWELAWAAVRGREPAVDGRDARLGQPPFHFIWVSLTVLFGFRLWPDWFSWTVVSRSSPAPAIVLLLAWSTAWRRTSCSRSP